MRKSLLLMPLLFAVAACGQKSEDAVDKGPPTNMAEESADAASSRTEAPEGAVAPPDIDTSVAPGVAFDFRYIYALESQRIGGVQEEHAQACKKLGIAKCRVTSMNYEADGDGDIAAMLAFKVDPVIATDFTRDAKSIVERAEGKLANATLTGTDLGSNVAVTEANADEVRAELTAIQRQIEMPGLSKEVRARLVEQAAQLREQLRAFKQSANGDKAALAMTPVVFEYHTLHSIPGLDNSSTLSEIVATSVSSFMTMLRFVLVIIGALAPWAFLAGAGYWVVQRLRRKRKPVDVA